MGRKSRFALACCVILMIGGFVGYVVEGHRLFLLLIGFLGLLATLVSYGYSGSTGYTVADDLRRADEEEPHPMPEGPAPPGPS